MQRKQFNIKCYYVTKGTDEQWCTTDAKKIKKWIACGGGVGEQAIAMASELFQMCLHSVMLSLTICL